MIIYIWTKTEISRQWVLLPVFILNQLRRWARGGSVVCLGTGEAKALRGEADGTEMSIYVPPGPWCCPGLWAACLTSLASLPHV